MLVTTPSSLSLLRAPHPPFQILRCHTTPDSKLGGAVMTALLSRTFRPARGYDIKIYATNAKRSPQICDRHPAPRLAELRVLRQQLRLQERRRLARRLTGCLFPGAGLYGRIQQLTPPLGVCAVAFIIPGTFLGRSAPVRQLLLIRCSYDG